MSENIKDSATLTPATGELCIPVCSDQPPDVQRRADGRNAQGQWVRGRSGNPDTKFQAGNRESVRTGAYVTVVKHAELASLAADVERAVIQDLGGADEVSRVMRGLVQRFASLEVLTNAMFERLLVEGPFTLKGRTRASFTGLLNLIDRYERVARAIGTARRTKRPTTLADLLANYEPAAVPPDAASTPAPATSPTPADVETGSAPACASGDSGRPDGDEEATC